MSTAAIAPSPARETKWTVVSGAMVGSVRLMNAESFSIGRSPECEFVIISDPKCSRKHAQIEWRGDSCELSSLNLENLVQVNDQPVAHAVLADGDMILLGTTKVQFNLTSVADESSIRHRQLSVVSRSTQAPQSPTPHSQRAPEAYGAPIPQSRPRRQGSVRRAPGGKSNTGRFVIYGIIAAVIGYVVFSDPAKKKELLKLRTEQQITAEIETANKLQESALNQPQKRFDQSVTSKQAQENYVRGFRDFRKGQFERSLDAFQACLALDPAHVLCNRYIRVAQRRFNELVQYDIVLGRKYRDQNQFKPCIAAFRNVMSMVKDANSAPYKEAKANYEACNALAEGRY